MLKKINHPSWQKLRVYLQELQIGDPTNREGHAAKVYFNALFDKGFNRDEDNDINAALNYGYSILLSNFNKEITSCGYLTQLGMKHCNEFNHFNLSSDLMEPFRILIDEIVYENKSEIFNKSYKCKLVDILNKKVVIDNKEQYLTNAIVIYVRSIFKSIEQTDIKEINHFDFV